MKKAWQQTTLCVLIGCVGANLLLLAWALNKGFDVTDEGSYMLEYTYPREALFRPRAHHLLMHALLGWMNPGIITYRVVRLVLTLAASYVFARGFWNFYRNAQPQPAFGFAAMLLLVAMGNFLSYAFGPQTLSYNHLNNFLILFASGMALSVLPGGGDTKETVGVGAGIGLLTALQFLAKFSSSIVLLTVLGVLLLVGLAQMPFSKRCLVVAGMVGGFVAGIGLLCLVVPGVAAWLKALPVILATQASSEGYSVGGRLSFYAGELRFAVARVLRQYGYFLLALFLVMRLYAVTRNTGLLRNRVLFLACAAGVCLLFLKKSYLVSFSPDASAYHRSFVYIAVLAGLLVAATAAGWERISLRSIKGAFSNRTLLVGCFLFVLPLVGAVGTGTALLAGAMNHLTGWFCLIGLASLQLAKQTLNIAILSLFLIVPVACAQYQIVQRAVLFPYGLPKSLLKQTESLPGINLARGMKFDRETKELVAGLVRALEAAGFQPGDPIIAAYGMPGLVYLAGGMSPGTPWFFQDPGLQAINCQSLRRSHVRDLGAAFVLLKDEITPQFSRCLHEAGVRYPEGYELAGTTWLFDVERNARLAVGVYRPKQSDRFRRPQPRE